MANTQTYQWVGDGVLATLTIRRSDDIRGITYSMDLEFEDFGVEARRLEESTARDLAEGDAKGWGSTAQHQKDIAAERARVILLEQNALKRGDRVIPR